MSFTLELAVYARLEPYRLEECNPAILLITADGRDVYKCALERNYSGELVKPVFQHTTAHAIREEPDLVGRMFLGTGASSMTLSDADLLLRSHIHTAMEAESESPHSFLELDTVKNTQGEPVCILWLAFILEVSDWSLYDSHSTAY